MYIRSIDIVKCFGERIFVARVCVIPLLFAASPPVLVNIAHAVELCSHRCRGVEMKIWVLVKEFLEVGVHFLWQVMTRVIGPT